MRQKLFRSSVVVLGTVLTATSVAATVLVTALAVMLDGDAIVATWGTPETEVGETTYRLTASASMEIIDRVRGKDGQWREFGRTLLQRVK